MKKIILVVCCLFILIFMYFNTPYSKEKMQQKFYDYLVENVENYKDYELFNFGLYEGQHQREDMVVSIDIMKPIIFIKSIIFIYISAIMDMISSAIMMMFIMNFNIFYMP